MLDRACDYARSRGFKTLHSVQLSDDRAAIALEQRQSAFQVWSKNFTWLSINYFSGASMAALLVAFGGQKGANVLGAIWIVLPLLAITYFTYKSSMARIDDANKHVEKLNTL